MSIKKEYLLPGQIFFRKSSAFYRTILGSCVSVILEEKKAAGASGICHYLNSHAPDGKRDHAYGDFAISDLISKFELRGIAPSGLQARVFGGANVNGDKITGTKLCRENIAVARSKLKEFGIDIVEEDCGGKFGREITYDSVEKKATVKSQDPTASKDVGRLFKLIYKLTGNDPSEKSSFYFSEVSRFKRSLNIESFEDLITEIKKSEKNKKEFINRMTNHSTEWFRHPNTYQHLIEHNLMKNMTEQKRVLSAGCSLGKEIFSLAMLTEQAGIKNVIFEAIDIDEVSVDFAKKGAYPKRELSSIPIELQTSFELNGDDILVKSDIKRKVIFKVGSILNFNDVIGKYDAILCQNVLIYFSDVDISKILSNFSLHLKKGGHLYLNRKENPTHEMFENLGEGILRKR